ncbi:DegT/DnrJ/EryC1/StrS family aminotransferase [Peribacillus sp. TH16]|uniref:DegT/DnrJ/EryC1/StrS family aminotransferase n=1 Tax=Peribacillus sp. TH16 TaxID=2798482 RepID=UPI00406D1218
MPKVSVQGGNSYVSMPNFTFFTTLLLATIWCGIESFFVDTRSDNWCMDEKSL